MKIIKVEEGWKSEDKWKGEKFYRLKNLMSCLKDKKWIIYDIEKLYESNNRLILRISVSFISMTMKIWRIRVKIKFFSQKN